MKTSGITLQLQTGAILVVSLVLLTVMTLIGITAMQTTIMQEKMAGNSRDLSLAFEAAEAANREGENWLSDLANMPDARACNSGICLVWNDEGGAGALFSATGAAYYTDPSLWENARLSSMINLEGVHNPPAFVVEFTERHKESRNLGQQQDLKDIRGVFRVTSRGTGATDAARAYVQTSFARRF